MMMMMNLTRRALLRSPTLLLRTRQIHVADDIKLTPFLKFLQFMDKSSMFSEKRKMELYPPYFLMRVKVKDISNGWRRIRVKLPLNFTSRNPGGVMFGGYQACVADPFPAIACGRIFPEYSAWTRAMTVDFQKGGTSDLEFRFDFDRTSLLYLSLFTSPS